MATRGTISPPRGLIPQDSYDLRADWGNAEYDIRHSFAGFITYSAPTPSRLKLLLGGWQFNSLLTLYSGSPFRAYTGSDTSLTQENNVRAEIVSNTFAGVPADIKGSYAYWFNPNAFALPTLGTYSNQARNSLRGPPTYQVDFSEFKNNKITERLDLQLRVEIFNLFNTRDLSVPNNTVTGSGLGQITQTLDVYNGAPGIGTGAPRNVQLAAKIVFRGLLKNAVLNQRPRRKRLLHSKYNCLQKSWKSPGCRMAA